jgi:ankyrin repeat protein
MDCGVDPLAGFGTGMNGFHWAANRGQLETVKMLIERKVPMEVENMYDGTVLGCTVWSAVHQPREGQLEVIGALLTAGANVDAAEYPSGNAEVDEVLRRHGAKPSV